MGQDPPRKEEVSKELRSTPSPDGLRRSRSGLRGGGGSWARGGAAGCLWAAEGGVE